MIPLTHQVMRLLCSKPSRLALNAEIGVGASGVALNRPKRNKHSINCPANLPHIIHDQIVTTRFFLVSALFSASAAKRRLGAADVHRHPRPAGIIARGVTFMTIQHYVAPQSAILGQETRAGARLVRPALRVPPLSWRSAAVLSLRTGRYNDSFGKIYTSRSDRLR